jgi:SAM-dependent methyltransferase
MSSTRPAAASTRTGGATLYTTQGGHGCPVCGSPARRAAEVGAFRLYSCARCGCWSSDALACDALTSFEPCAYFHNAASDAPKWQRLLARLGDATSRIRSVLDVGCGTGAFLRFAAGALPGARLSGIELDVARATAARAANPGATIHAGDATTVLEGLADSYDLITLWDVLEHVPEPARLVRALGGRLARDGLMFVQTIHEHSLLPTLGRLSYRLTGGRFRAGIRRTHDAHHLVFFSRAGLGLLAADAALEIRQLWFDRLAHARLDGSALLTVPASILMTAENICGNGLFLNVILATAGASGRR